MPLLLVAILAPRLSRRIVTAAWCVVDALDCAREAIEPIACDMSHAASNADEWRRDLGLDNDGKG